MNFFILFVDNQTIILENNVIDDDFIYSSQVIKL